MKFLAKLLTCWAIKLLRRLRCGGFKLFEFNLIEEVQRAPWQKWHITITVKIFLGFSEFF